MKEYIKINNITFKEKILFLFTNIIKKEYMINNEYQDITIRKEFFQSSESIMDEKSVSDYEIKLDIPFFDLTTDETKSNL